MFDIIGDVHGYGDKLAGLLKGMGYEKTHGVFKHPERKAIFVGDIINRGPRIKECLRLVRSMWDAGNALMVPGNHEFNLLTYLYAQKHKAPIPEHLSFNQKTLDTTLEVFQGKSGDLQSYAKWLSSLPLFLEPENIRIVHAMWYPASLHVLSRFFPKPNFDEDFLQIVFTNVQRWEEVAYLFRGIEIPFPNELSLDRGKVYRMKWWENAFGKSFETWSARTGDHLPDKPVSVEQSLRYPGYEANEPPVFFGHYCLDMKPELMAPNVCCLDFCVVKSGHLTAYRWLGEGTLLDSRFFISPE